MHHKNLEFNHSADLFRENSIEQVEKQWHSSLTHQINKDAGYDPREIIQEVIRRIQENI